MPSHILITGASSGLGAALALAYARTDIVLSLSGRNAARLEATAKQARDAGAQTHVCVVDVDDQETMQRWIEERHAYRPIDLVIANAGISAGTGAGDETRSQSHAIFQTNLFGVLNTVFPALALMKKSGHGQIAIISSLAGFRGVAGAPSYCASKAAVRVFGEALRGEMAAHDIKINVVCPGFIKTPMTDINTFPMPFLWSAEKAALYIQKGLKNDKARIAFPWPMRFMVRILELAPLDAMDRFLNRFPRKPSVSA